MNYLLSEEAKDGLIRIHQYGTLRFGAKQADAYFDAFFEQFAMIANNPLHYPAVNHIRKGYRRCTCGVDSIYYRIEDDVVQIMTIVGRQDTTHIT